jgi:hypothetical protein
MDNFKKVSLNAYGWEMSFSKEIGKSKLRKAEKKYIRKLSRVKLKRVKEEY